MKYPGMLIAYDADGNVVGTLSFRVWNDPAGAVIGIIHFAEHEERGGEVTDFWRVSSAVGAKVWPEYIGSAAHRFRVERAGPPGNTRLVALVHQESGYRRERSDIEAVVAARAAATPVGEPIDLRDIVGGPGAPITLDAAGATAVADPVDVADAIAAPALIGAELG